MVNLWTGKDAKSRNFGGVTIDATLSESYRFSNSKTQYPVEVGFDVSDNVTKKPREYTLEGVVSASPLFSLIPGTNRTRIKSAYQTLKELAGWKTTASTPKIFSIVTDLDVYQNMVITDLRIDRDVDSGDCMKFSATLEQIVLSSTMYSGNIGSLGDVGAITSVGGVLSGTNANPLTQVEANNGIGQKVETDQSTLSKMVTPSSGVDITLIDPPPKPKP